MTKATRYFVAGDPKTAELFKDIGGYEESFFFIFGKATNDHILKKTPEDCKKDHLAHGMSPEFYNQTARIFRVTVEEVPRSEWENKK